jgi:hypothetical protein
MSREAVNGDYLWKTPENPFEKGGTLLKPDFKPPKWWVILQ